MFLMVFTLTRQRTKKYLINGAMLKIEVARDWFQMHHEEYIKNEAKLAAGNILPFVGG